jgi:hypothetical protein
MKWFLPVAVVSSDLTSKSELSMKQAEGPTGFRLPQQCGCEPVPIAVWGLGEKDLQLAYSMVQVPYLR